MSLQSWLQMGHLIEHQATVAEVRSLLGVVDRELADAGVAGLSDEGRFTHAYDAGLLLCKLALHVSGFELQKRAKGHHSQWIMSLEHSLGKEKMETLIHLSKDPVCATQVSMTKRELSRSKMPLICLKRCGSYGRMFWPGCIPSIRPLCRLDIRHPVTSITRQPASAWRAASVN